MILYKTISLLTVVIATGWACSLHRSEHDPEKAATTAYEFAKAAFLDRDMDRAYSLLDMRARSNVPKEKFIEAVNEMNLDNKLDGLIATDFEPIRGQDAINIYLTGVDGPQEYYYRIPMIGNAPSGYKPVGLLRGEYAASDSRQPLRSTKK